jgi:8-oxo-dGTP pyrophosphatase MutT (NUDIX family)
LYLTHKEYKDWRVARVNAKWHVEPGEDVMQAAIRETTEETWFVNIEIMSELSVVQFKYMDWETKNVKDVHWFLAYTTDNKPWELALTEWEIWTIWEQKWVHIDDVAKTLTYDNDKKVWAEVLDLLQY